MVSYLNYMLRDKLLKGCKQVYSCIHHEIISILVSAKKEGVKLLFMARIYAQLTLCVPLEWLSTRNRNQTLPLTVKNWKLT